MITYRDHKEVLKHFEDIEGWLLSLDEFEQLEWSGKISAGYPFGEPTKIDGLYEQIDIERMIFGQFIMIESAITADIDYRARMDIILPLILRPHPSKFDNDDPKIEEGIRSLIESSDAAYIEDLIDRFLIHRGKILHEKYAGVVYSAPREDDEDEDVEETDTIADDESSFNKDFYFYSHAKSFVNDDLTRINEAYELPMKTVFPELIFKAKKSKIEEARNRLANFMK